VTTRRTHEEVETRLVLGLNRILPKPRIVEHYRTTGPCDFRAIWALDRRLCLLECEVKTTAKAIRKVPLPPDQLSFARRLKAIARLVSPPPANTFEALHERKPLIGYAVFVYRKRRPFRKRGKWVRPEPETFIHTTSRLARTVLAAAWEAGA